MLYVIEATPMLGADVSRHWIGGIYESEADATHQAVRLNVSVRNRNRVTPWAFYAVRARADG
jgi:hypothetical protein